MRSISSFQDPIRHPLNLVLGRESHVRILRALCDIEGSAGAATLAEQVGMSLPGTLKALETLVSTGIVLRRGSGRGRQYELAPDSLQSVAIRELFDTESGWHLEFVDQVRGAIEDVAPLPRSVWRRAYAALSPPVVDLVVLHEASAVNAYVRELRQRLLPIEQRFDLTIEILGLTEAEIGQTDLQDATLLFGVPPGGPQLDGTRPAIRSHADLDARSRARAAVFARWACSEPTLLPRAKRRVEHLLRTDHGTATAALEEWGDILHRYSPRRIAALLTARSPRAERLRQSSPFPAVLNAKERRALQQEVP